VSKKRKAARKAGFDSHLERKLGEGVLKDIEYHPDPISYTVPATYTADFKYGNILIEVKGFLRVGQPKMYRCIAEKCEELGFEFVFLFENPEKKMVGARKRKDGTVLTLGEWADKVGIRWFTEDTIHQLWSNNATEN